MKRKLNIKITNYLRKCFLTQNKKFAFRGPIKYLSWYFQSWVGRVTANEQFFKSSLKKAKCKKRTNGTIHMILTTVDCPFLYINWTYSNFSVVGGYIKCIILWQVPLSFINILLGFWIVSFTHIYMHISELGVIYLL